MGDVLSHITTTLAPVARRDRVLRRQPGAACGLRLRRPVAAHQGQRFQIVARLDPPQSKRHPEPTRTVGRSDRFSTAQARDFGSLTNARPLFLTFDSNEAVNVAFRRELGRRKAFEKIDARLGNG